MKSTIQNKQKSNAELYFKKFDKCKFDNDYYNLFTKDVEIYFPKFGFIYGKEDIRKFTGIMAGLLKELMYDIEKLNYIILGNIIAVEYTEKISQ